MWSKKDFCALTGCTGDALRHYEEMGLIAPQRGANRYRIYSETEYKKIKYIKVMRYAGFSLKEIKDVLLLADKEVSLQCQESTTAIFANKIKEIEQKVKTYTFILQKIQTFMSKRDIVLNGGQYDINYFTDEMVDKIFVMLAEKGIE